MGEGHSTAKYDSLERWSWLRQRWEERGPIQSIKQSQKSLADINESFVVSSLLTCRSDHVCRSVAWSVSRVNFINIYGAIFFILICPLERDTAYTATLCRHWRKHFCQEN